MNALSVRREQLIALEDEIAKCEQLEVETKHHFAHGTYTREVFLPAGTVLTGKVHRHSCINIISKGKILVVTDEGEYVIEAPHTFVSGANVKKAGAVLEDTIWLNVHPWNNEDDLEQIEAMVVIPMENRLWHG
jgi:hypothetical protein